MSLGRDLRGAAECLVTKEERTSWMVVVSEFTLLGVSIAGLPLKESMKIRN